MILLLAMAASVAAAPPKYAFSEPPKAQEPKGAIESVLLFPLFREPFICGDHPAGEGSIVGDELGTDCQVQGGVLDENRSFARLYRTDGRKNEDWYSWGADVLSPAAGIVTGLLPNPRVNEPGTKGRPPAGMILIRRADGLTIVCAHLTDFAVALGDRVEAGQLIAKVGNNGPSYAPHVHVGAYRGLEPLQIRWDQRAMAKLQSAKP
jgi:hypothetical protein